MLEPSYRRGRRYYSWCYYSAEALMRARFEHAKYSWVPKSPDIGQFQAQMAL
jgi:hypothetical protein